MHGAHAKFRTPGRGTKENEQVREEMSGKKIQAWELPKLDEHQRQPHVRTPEGQDTAQ